MPRRKRCWTKGACYHITQRCHERNFLFKFSKYRDLYLKHLLLAVRKFGIDLLDYMVTSNHVHLLVRAGEQGELSRALQYAHGRVGQSYNARKGREGSFWKDRFHSTRIQDGEHLARAMFYIDMNMVRAGAVEEPSEWKHSGYRELAGLRRRNRLINIRRLIRCLGHGGKELEEFRKWYMSTLKSKVSAAKSKREPWWTESVAVGEPTWLEKAARSSGLKRYEIRRSAKINYLASINKP